MDERKDGRMNEWRNGQTDEYFIDRSQRGGKQNYIISRPIILFMLQ